ncbi:hypothetical protein OG978_32850 [Streptomyces sp. NBC_01591]|uniref:hypothetical protein n=1 Tax=Streptomyces sp. NBC_01591 TaxID=2975888 RepID=UPI002DDA7844|nr:hypothetical protein [Streptomyces sp. NBC_01591]WSD71764.1 hypothetical protein OG978_32850 [Streptomyces sp. NBC_01591]
MIVGGDGITVDGAGNPANPLVITAKPAPLVVADGDCITLSGNGTAGAPLSAAPRLDPNPANLLACGPDGLVVTGGTGGTVATACGLTGDGSTGAPLAAAVAQWTAACDLDTEGGQVYCDSAGQLRADPPPKFAFYTDNASQTFPATEVPAGSDVPIIRPTLTILNPDGCREAHVLVNVDLDMDFNLPANSGAGCGIGPDDMQYVVNRGSTAGTSVHNQVSKTWHRVIPAGGTLVEPMQITGLRGSGGATYTRIQWGINAFVWVV